ncbi:hypothetical protein [Synechococcus sp. CS-603]|uniref:hypothetical protein n=1 Tax=Synechococcus sp. CS-603 TaxID=2847981 RepID=UPI00223B30F8|nr:hypothetical protein [Synechococcus sp. CS-603]MCT0201802.1 hypothetical protein [Synechococcus sp. CS-603]
MSHVDPAQIVESVKFLLKSVRQLSDRFRETNEKLERSFEAIAQDVAGISGRLEQLERNSLSVIHKACAPVNAGEAPGQPAQEEKGQQSTPALNLPLDQIIDIYGHSPTLLEPFSRPCSLSGRTLSGEIEHVELESFSQGSTWALEILGAQWLLLPRPGSLERRAQVQSLERLFEIEGSAQLPATLHLHKPATALSIQHGRRWTLLDRGRLSVNADPLRQNTSQMLARLAARLDRLENSRAE